MSFFSPINESIEEKQYPLLSLTPELDTTDSSQKKKPFDRFVYSYTTDSKALDDFISELLLELELTRPAKQSKALRAVLMNLIYSHQECVGLYRSTSYTMPKRLNPDQIGQRTLRTVLNALEKGDYINQDTGSKTNKTLTLITPTPKLNWAFGERFLAPYWVNGKDEPKLIRRLDPVVLKNKSKKIIDYEDTLYTNHVRETLNKYEEQLAYHDIDYVFFGKDEAIAYPFNIRRTFNHSSFHKGGRISARWTQLKKKDRKNIAIDGEKTIEIDMPCSSMNIIYRAATNAPYQGDAYRVEIRGQIIPRKFGKQYLTIAQNNSELGTGKTFIKELKKDETWDEFQSLGITVSELKEALMQKHSTVHQYLFRPSTGMKIQWAESELVFLVLRELTERGIPTLTVFDSFIVKESDGDVVSEVLRTVSDSCMDDYLRYLK